MPLTDAEIVAYNAGVEAYTEAGQQVLTSAAMLDVLRDKMDERTTKALERLGEDVFFAWVGKGASDAKARAAR